MAESTRTLKICFGRQIFNLVVKVDGNSFSAEIDGKMELSWNDAEDKARSATLVFMLHADRRVSYRTKLERIKFFENCILLFQKRMIKCPQKISDKKLAHMCRKKKLPQLTILEATTMTGGLKKLFRHFGTEEGSWYEMEWKKLVAAAQKGNIVKLWIAEKRKEQKASSALT